APSDKAAEAPSDKAAEAPKDMSVDDRSSKDKAPTEVSEGSLVLLDKQVSTAADKRQQDARYQQKLDAALAVSRANTERTSRLAASQDSPYAPDGTAKASIPNKEACPGYNPFGPLDGNKVKELAEWLKNDL